MYYIIVILLLLISIPSYFILVINLCPDDKSKITMKKNIKHIIIKYSLRKIN